MVFAQIRGYMKSRGRASIDDIVAKFDGDKSAVEGMMATLVERGQVVELGCGTCGSSGGCSFVGPKMYAYSGADGLAASPSTCGTA